MNEVGCNSCLLTSSQNFQIGKILLTRVMMHEGTMFVTSIVSLFMSRSLPERRLQRGLHPAQPERLSVGQAALSHLHTS